MKSVETNRAPAAIGPYSQAIVTDTMIYTSGQIPLDPETGLLTQGDIALQTRRALDNLAAVLEAAGSNLTKVVKTTCFLQDMADFAAFNAVYETYFPGKPARSCVQAAALPKGALVEVEAIAAR